LTLGPTGSRMSFDRRWATPPGDQKRRCSMNKSGLIGAMAESAGVSNKDAGACLDAFFEVVAAEVAAGDAKVSVPGWISFEQVIRAARKGRNPQTGEEIQVAATRACKVSVGSKLKAAAKSSGAPGAPAFEAPAPEAPRAW